MTTEEVITTILKVISVTTKVILVSEEVITTTLQLCQALQSDLGPWISDHSHFKNDLNH